MQAPGTAEALERLAASVVLHLQDVVFLLGIAFGRHIRVHARIGESAGAEEAECDDGKDLFHVCSPDSDLRCTDLRVRLFILVR